MQRSPIHPIDCPCRLCAPRSLRNRLTGALVNCTVRLFTLIVLICALPFLIAHLLSGGTMDR